MVSLYPPFLLFVVALSLVASRAVNISNTWMLPEERFPVFYRYFRDRISWYEADAVCQFHHANLVTADSTDQYDAIRAYLKEMDITDDVWIGLSRTAEKSNFAWTDFKPFNGEGHWQASVPSHNEPICVAMDPASDFLWKPLSCGGPQVASFICEMPVPAWASGPKGCLLTELPSLTVLYIPEQIAIELTSDCGLDGTKRIACKGDADRDVLLKKLACTNNGDESDMITLPEMSNSSSTVGPSTTDHSNNLSTRHRRETMETPTPTSTTTELNRGETSMGTITETNQHLETTIETDKDGMAEYPSEINQGQLFSIIENGTMFDIIELNVTNETSSTKEIVSDPIEQTSQRNGSDDLYTTVVYQKEPPSDLSFVTNKSVKKGTKKSTGFKKVYTKDKTPKEPANLTKEYELFPIVATDSGIVLNRTNRKELPAPADYRTPSKINFTDVNHLDGDVGTEEPYEPEPEAQPRPNRQRQLTRPQRRSFYPYFFSRVLG